jgi:hypothetical protein
MIIENGTIQFKAKTVTVAIDPATGYPVKPSGVSWSAPIPCQYTPNSYSNLGRVNGEHFTSASYTVLVDEQALPDSEQLKLADCNGKELGTFSVISIEPLTAVCEIKILV